MLENILHKYFDLAEDWNDNFEDEEKLWNESYDKLIKLLYDLNNLGVLKNVNEIIDELDEIHNESDKELARFETKIVAVGEDYSSHNGELVEIIDRKEYNGETRYTIMFKNGEMADNIMNCELDFWYNC